MSLSPVDRPRCALSRPYRGVPLRLMYLMLNSTRPRHQELCKGAAVEIAWEAKDLQDDVVGTLVRSFWGGALPAPPVPWP